MNASHSSFPPTLMLLLTLTLALFSLASPVQAGDRGGRHITPEFEVLAVRDQGREITVDYALTRESWRSIRQAGIIPQFNVYVPNRRGRYALRHSVDLQARRGQIQYIPSDLRLGDARTVEVELVGQARGRSIRRIALGDACDDRLRLEVQSERGVKIIVVTPEPEPPIRVRPVRHVPEDRGAVIDACRISTKFDSDFNSCLVRANGLARPEAAEIVLACGSATRFGSDLLQCIDQAGQIAVNPVQVTRACGGATTHFSDMQACLGASAQYGRRDASSVVDACARHTRFGSDLATCVAASQQIRGGRVQVIDACGRATRFQSDFEQCLQTNQGRPRQESF